MYTNSSKTNDHTVRMRVIAAVAIVGLISATSLGVASAHGDRDKKDCTSSSRALAVGDDTSESSTDEEDNVGEDDSDSLEGGTLARMSLAGVPVIEVTEMDEVDESTSSSGSVNQIELTEITGRTATNKGSASREDDVSAMSEEDEVLSGIPVVVLGQIADNSSPDEDSDKSSGEDSNESGDEDSDDSSTDEDSSDEDSSDESSDESSGDGCEDSDNSESREDSSDEEPSSDTRSSTTASDAGSGHSPTGHTGKDAADDGTGDEGTDGKETAEEPTDGDDSSHDSSGGHAGISQTSSHPEAIKVQQAVAKIIAELKDEEGLRAAGLELDAGSTNHYRVYDTKYGVKFPNAHIAQLVVDGDGNIEWAQIDSDNATPEWMKAVPNSQSDGSGDGTAMTHVDGKGGYEHAAGH